MLQEVIVQAQRRHCMPPLVAGSPLSADGWLRVWAGEGRARQRQLQRDQIVTDSRHDGYNSVTFSHVKAEMRGAVARNVMIYNRALSSVG